MGAPAPDQPGLSAAEAAARLAADGPNELPASRPLGMWRLLVEVVSEPMFLLLGACGAIYLLLGDRGEALLLLAFVVVVVVMTFVQKRRAEHSLSALRVLSSPRALVVRGGRQQRIAGRELARGDIVLLAEGDRVPADIELLTASNLTVDESMLTGESAPVAKQPAGEGGGAGAGRVYAGTLVTNGTASGRVAATGPRSALGRIGASLSALGGGPTPIQRETGRVVRQVAVGGLGLAAGLGLVHWWLRGDWLRALLAGLTLAMAVLPEELPVVLTLFLGLGAWRLARRQVLARSIPAVELLGATSVLCVDKTGTLTANRMEVARLWSERARHDGADLPLPPALHALLEYAVLASHRLAFDPMEAAIGRAGAGWLAGSGRLHADWRLVDDYPLSRRLLAMSRVWQAPRGDGYLIAAKGAPEAIVDLCHLDAARADAIAAQVAAMARDGLRVIGVASAAFASALLPADQHAFDFVFLGLLALADPLRPEVPAAVAEAHAAGIRVVMITGDHPATALAIARQAGIAADGCLTGEALRGLDDGALAARLAGTSVYCRIAPEQKLRLVRAFRARGEIVAMTGDGVNDAPALKAADIGVAMGARGTDVAREAAALVLLADDFSSLLDAVRHGRRLYANLRKALVFIVAVHVPIVGLSVLPVLAGWPMLLMPVHILFLQLIIDPACSIVFEAEPLEADAMRRRPRDAASRLFDREILLRGLAQGGGLLVLLTMLYLQVRWRGGAHELARTAVFVALVGANVCLIHANRSWRGAWERPVFANRYFVWGGLGVLLLLLLALGVAPLRAVFGLVPPDPGAALGGLVVAMLSLAWFETVKRIAARRAARA
ncbi:cation-translocating P-type ATPase [Duganella sp. 1411]|uniref:cation-translocating P-type ATPase n=1 Tax=Duganella sp. 1411 TaxID=2806572 RepID=UPI001AE86068|nr:cation-translocating P-type ATPase [Duganella sp. 1411]